MGIFNFVRSGVREMMIARPDTARHLIVYKHPDRTIPKWAQLTVGADEAAVFFRDGSLVGVLRTAGVGQRHTLDAGNIPFLSKLVDSFTGGNVFVTDLFFVTMRPIRDTKFGGPLPPMKDPELEITVSPRIYGTFQWQIVEPDRFIVNYLGLGQDTSNERVTGFIQTKFMNAVKRTVPEFVIRRSIEVQALPAYHEELGQTFVQRCEDLSDIGVRFLGLGDFTINFSEEELRRIQEAQDRYAVIKAKKRAKDELAEGNYLQYAAGEAMLQANARGGGSGPMEAGMGMGMGVMMAQMYQHVLGNRGGVSGGGGHAVNPSPPVNNPQASGGKGGAVTCPSCGAQVPPGKFCAECGASLTPQPKPCTNCGALIPVGAKFCSECGTRAPI
ncbi:MAG: SPFH domain-containing protein [Sandaracinaceae bacterium]|nr:SPFH domain-containing protein [Sandaracinaceae bacterium]MDW8245008.1 SPFH domain-containing protein [Sandaracinaceae bacterium]